MMCELCDTSSADDGIVTCQDCGRIICFDNEPSNTDVADRAYVTASGDLFCVRCGRQYDEAEEAYEDDYDGFEYGYDVFEFDPYWRQGEEE